MEENQFLLKDLLEQIYNIGLQYQKMCILINQMTQFINTTPYLIEPLKKKLVDVKLSIQIGFNKENNKKVPKFKLGDHVRISKYKSIFAKDHVPSWSGEVFVIKKIKNTVLWTVVIFNQQ